MRSVATGLGPFDDDTERDYTFFVTRNGRVRCSVDYGVRTRINSYSSTIIVSLVSNEKPRPPMSTGREFEFDETRRFRHVTRESPSGRALRRVFVRVKSTINRRQYDTHRRQLVGSGEEGQQPSREKYERAIPPP